MVKLENISVSFRQKNRIVHAVRHVFLEVNRGEVFGIVGSSGAGKSTLLRTINLIERPTEGRVIVDGTDVTGLDKKSLRRARRKIGMIFQHFNLIHTKTVFDNIAFPLKISGRSGGEIAEKVPVLLDVVGLSD